jgi:hypothetical protein
MWSDHVLHHTKLSGYPHHALTRYFTAMVEFAMVPASGAGAHGRILLGIAVLSRMLAASGIAIFLIPVAYTVVETLVHRHDVLRRRDQRPIAGRRPAMAGPRSRPLRREQSRLTYGLIEPIEMCHWILTAIPVFFCSALVR